MSKFQLWSRDEYGQGSIIFTSENLDEVITEAKKSVTDINVNNALAETERDKNWENYFVFLDVPDKPSGKEYIYSERSGGAGEKNSIYEVTKSASGTTTVKSMRLKDIKNCKVKIYLGNLAVKKSEAEKPWYAMDIKKKLIDNIDHPELKEKTVLFIKVI